MSKNESGKTMKISDLYKNNDKPVVSFEIFPPKTDKGLENLRMEMGKLASFNPGYISVTYGAGGSTRDKTLDIAEFIAKDFSLTPLVHFTCVGFGRKEIAQYIKELKKRGIDNILALRGDPPQGSETFVAHEDGFSYANELVEYIRSIDDFTIGVAGYPEGHIEAHDIDTDIENLVKKVDAGADFIITQLFYHNDDFYQFIDRVEKKNINIPIIPGIMPVTNLSQTKKITSMCGATIPDKLIRALSQCTSDEGVCQRGMEYTIAQTLELKSWGVDGFHFYTLNKSEIPKKIIETIGLA
jgi:methylenetetrahydrofolate reductase (NADPH)